MKIQSDTSDVHFECTDYSAEQRETTDLATFHETMLANSPTYAASVRKATSTASVKIAVSNVFEQAGLTSFNSTRRQHEIEINPTIESPKFRTRSGVPSRKTDARLSLAFEMQNAATERQLSACDAKAKSGGYKLDMRAVPPVAASLMERFGRAATLYAIDVESIEHSNTSKTHQIEQELAKRGADRIGETLGQRSFDDYLRDFIDSGHAEQYCYLYARIISGS
ncbi:hypothetical protein GWC77_25575 [Paraburkholderia sp. NMBU_R16]|uniref:hypothetical protein n=1 Tax=Paraburkholderia sp. NMBU_R16 TaxID=2698676 RepID=UPI0015636324|nr:hypothetical protein [Paraburkholderia sp. NMBU_R16]NRO99264.1 hypothetical protein [Paraburkholderia sp. NMBU_R16]